MEILDRSPYALDFSMLGAGKTYTAARVALDRAFAHILVICPVSVIPKWSFMRDTHASLSRANTVSGSCRASIAT